MPIYQYKCAGCNKVTEVVRGINENTPDLFCETCETSMKRYYGAGAFGVQFNGSGWASKDK